MAEENISLILYCSKTSLYLIGFAASIVEKHRYSFVKFLSFINLQYI